MEKKENVKKEPDFRDKYKGARDSGVKFILEDKDGNQTEIKR